MRFIFLFLVVIPMAELWLLISVGREIGAWSTLGLVILTAMVGFSLLRQQGFSTLFRARQKMDAGELPATEMVEAIILTVCGVLLMTPGFITDVIGFIGLIPPVRALLVARVVSKIQVVDRNVQVNPDKTGPKVLDGEFWHEETDKHDQLTNKKD